MLTFNSIFVLSSEKILRKTFKEYTANTGWDFRTLAGVASFSILLSTNILTRVLWASHGGFIRFQKLGIAYDYKKLSSRENQTRVYTGQKWAVEMLSRLRFFSFLARSPYFIECLPSTSFDVWLKMIFLAQIQVFQQRMNVQTAFCLKMWKSYLFLLLFQICTKTKTCAAKTQNLKKKRKQKCRIPWNEKVRLQILGNFVAKSHFTSVLAKSVE